MMTTLRARVCATLWVFGLGASLAFAEATDPPISSARAEASPETPQSLDDAARECGERVAAAVQSRYERVRDFRARFSQSTERVGFPGEVPDALKAGGEVFFQKPGRMRWNYDRPAPSLVVSDGEGAWVYDPVAGEAQHFELGGEFLSGAALQFLLGEGRLLDAFRVASATCERPDAAAVELRPLEDSSFEALTLIANAGSGEVSETYVIDLLGNRTRLELSDVRTGEARAPEFFEFTPPEGVRVLRLPRDG